MKRIGEAQKCKETSKLERRVKLAAYGRPFDKQGPSERKRVDEERTKVFSCTSTKLLDSEMTEGQMRGMEAHRTKPRVLDTQ